MILFSSGVLRRLRVFVLCFLSGSKGSFFVFAVSFLVFLGSLTKFRCLFCVSLRF